VFNANYQLIQVHNNDPTTTFNLSVNQFTGWLSSEFSSTLGFIGSGRKTSSLQDQEQEPQQIGQVQASNLPDSYSNDLLFLKISSFRNENIIFIEILNS
jgi:hypothetical protein